jgi:hypothetical protein
MDPYRDPELVLRERLQNLQRRIGELDEHARQLEEAARLRARLEAEKATVERELFELSGTGSGQLEALRIASPCKASWAEMVGDERVRYCGLCAKNVYNFSAMTRAEAAALVRERTGELCVRMYKREDGTVMTSDCPVGAKKKRVRRLLVLGAGVGAAAAASAFGFTTTSTTGAIAPRGVHVEHVEVPVPSTAYMMGDVAAVGTAAVPPTPPTSQPLMGAPMPPPPPPPQTKMGKVSAVKDR